MATFQIEIISREIIRPSSPTPPHLRNFSLSYFDQIASRMYVPLVLFYNPSNTTTTSSEKSHLLKKSLSEILTLYFPFAGRLKGREFIDCNDEGVLCLEAKVNVKLSQILSNPNLEELDLLFADNLGWKESNLSASLLAVQISFFECGGMAISVCMSHKIGDAATMITFINDLAAKASNSSTKISPLFNTSSMFPPCDLPMTPDHVPNPGKNASRRFVFDASRISALKAMVAQHKVESPTRAEVVSALVYKCAISAAKKSSGAPRPTLLQTMINMRPRLIPQLPENFVGNLVWFSQVTRPEDGETELHSLVGQMKEALAELSNTYVKKFRGKEWLLSMRSNMEKSKELAKRRNQVQYVISSWCRFPIYKADFGWGDPVWVSIGRCVDKNVIILMDTKSGDGIEAFVTLEEQDMVNFEHDEELLAFSTFNPTPLGSFNPSNVNEVASTEDARNRKSLLSDFF